VADVLVAASAAGQRKHHPHPNPQPQPHPRIQLPSGDNNEGARKEEQELLRHDVDKKLAGTAANAASGHVRQRLGWSARW